MPKNEVPTDLNERVDWLVEKRLKSIRYNRTWGRVWRYGAILALLVAVLGIVRTIHDEQLDSSRRAKAAAEQVIYQEKVQAYFTCLGTQQAREGIRDTIIVLLNDSPTTTPADRDRILGYFAPGGKLAPVDCVRPSAPKEKGKP